MSQYIGKTISLVSVTDNRYVGLLEGIDSDKGTVTLREVRCFGTEGRKNWGPDEIYPNATVYKSVKFNGNEVKDLNILDVKLEEVQPQAPPASALKEAAAYTPAAAVQHQQQPQQPQVPAAVAGYGVYAPVPSATGTSEKSTAVPSSEPKPTHQEHHRKSRSNDQEHHTQNQNQNQRQKQRNHASHVKKMEIPAEDFDFQTNNAKFTKDGFENSNSHDHGTAETIEESESVPIKQDDPHTANPDSFYNKKSSFFDTISTSTDSNTNIKWQEEKAMNLDTFGQASARPRFGGRGSGRGGRGGRGRGGNYRGGSGNHRGNYNNNRNNSNNANFGQQHHSQDVEF